MNSPLSALEAVKGKSVTMPTRQSIRLHKDRGDQDVLVKFYAPGEVIKSLIHPIFDKTYELRDQEAANKRHAEIARILGYDRKSAEGRIREGAHDTADFKMEGKGQLRAGHFLKQLESHGFKIIQSLCYAKARGAEEQNRLTDKYGPENVHIQHVIEIRFAHESVFGDKLLAMQTAGEKGLGRNQVFLQELRNRVCPSQWGACTVFSNNTATVDPTITVNFRNPPVGTKPQELALVDGEIKWIAARV